MGITVTNLPVTFASPQRVVSASRHPRRVEISNTGTSALWLGTDDVAPGRGRQLLPGDDPYLYANNDELYAAAFSSTSVVVVEEA